MQKELLPPNLIIENLEDRLEKLKHIVAQKKKQQNNEMQQGHLRIAQISKTPQYYHCTDPKDFNGKYIPSSQKKFINQLAQKDYDIKVIKLLEKEIEVTQKYLSNVATNEDTINNESYIQTKLIRLYTNLTPARQQLITPVTLTDEQYAEQWQSVSWQERPFAQDEHYLLTNRNEKVRSKSEVLIANALAKHGIAYRYEYPQTLKNSQNKMITFHPDFLCLNIKTRVEYIWEHFGLMDNPDYAQKAVRKLQFYAQNKIFPGHNLIITMETQTEPLTPQFVETMIKEYFYSSTR